MPGPKPKVNFTPFLGQYTCTINNVFHRLGKDQEDAETHFKFLMKQAELGNEADPNITFKEVADTYLDFVEENFTAERYRHCTERLQEFKNHIGNALRAKDVRPKHIDSWLATKKKLTKGSERLYKSILLACLNWAARPRTKKGGELIPENPLRGQLHLPQGESRGKDAVWTQDTYEQVLKYASPAFTDLVRISASARSREHQPKVIESICRMSVRSLFILMTAYSCAPSPLVESFTKTYCGWLAR